MAGSGGPLDSFRALYFPKKYNPTPAAMARRPHGIPAAKPILALLLGPLDDLGEDPVGAGDDNGEEFGLYDVEEDDGVDGVVRDSLCGVELIELITVGVEGRDDPDVLARVSNPGSDSGRPSVTVLHAIICGYLRPQYS
jgi:hypothetical protein